MVTRKEIKWQIVDNIEVIVETNGKRFDLRINIYPQTVKSRNIKTEYFNYKLKLLKGRKKLKETIHLVLKNQRYKPDCATKKFWHTFKEEGYYLFTIGLKPQMYVSRLRLKKQEQAESDQNKVYVRQ